mgnify:CR=1 FL=1
MLILLLIPTFAAAVRRLHDVNTSGFFIFISIIPVLGQIIVLVKIIAKGTLGKNRFGEYPLAFKKKDGEKKIKENEEEIATQPINIKQDKDFFIKVLWRGDYSLKQSFWALYLLPMIIFSLFIFKVLIKCWSIIFISSIHKKYHIYRFKKYFYI